MPWSTLAAYATAFAAAVALHELAHFAAARWFGVRVTRVALFLDANDRALLRLQSGRTTFVLGWLPLGGYTEVAGVKRIQQGFMGRLFAPLPWELQARSPWVQVVVVLAGVWANLCTAMTAHLMAPDALRPLVLVSVVMGLRQLLPTRGTDGWLLVEVLCGDSALKGFWRFVMWCSVLLLAALIAAFMSVEGVSFFRASLPDLFAPWMR